MSFRSVRIINILFIGALLSGVGFDYFNLGPSKARAASNLDGRILLQVQDKGQAWYVNPLNSSRYYLGRPDDAFNLIRSLGLGVSNQDLAAFKNSAPTRLAGRILLQVQDKGQAYYVGPLDLKLYYLGRPADAFNLMRSQGLGITNLDLSKIPVYQAVSAPSRIGHFTFKYQNADYEIIQDLSASIYESYRTSPKVYTYYGSAEPADLREAFYGLFLQAKPGDRSLDDLASKLQAIAAQHAWSDDQLAEFTMALIQYLPYDHAKLADDPNRNTNPYYPYETLYLGRGVCSDKSFLGLALLRKLGFGAAMLDFPDKNHSAIGLACPIGDSLNGSGYCYVETTNFFPLGVIPQSISSGQAQAPSDGFSNLFDSASLGRTEIYQKTGGKIYNGLPATRAKAASLKAAKDNLNVLQTEIDSLLADIKVQESHLKELKAKMDNYYAAGQIHEYNSLVPGYNVAVNKYNSDLAVYQAKINEHNDQANAFNRSLNEFYQK
jgi:hypothetical protein